MNQSSRQYGSTNQSQWRSLLADSLTVFWGDLLDLRVRITQVAASGLVAPLIYILAFGLGLGSSLPQPAIGNSYLEFILPGMVALSSMTIGFGGTTFSKGQHFLILRLYPSG